jgi:uncharacterized protein YvpB
MSAKSIKHLSITFFCLAMTAITLLLLVNSSTAEKSRRPQQQEQINAFVAVPTAVVAHFTPETPAPTSATMTTATPTATVVEMTPIGTVGAYPDSFYITNITGHQQAYHLSCESASAVDWANYFGVPILEYDFQVALPHSDNPEYGFVGDVNSLWGQIPPYAYGVYSGPVADLLQQYGLPAKSVTGYSLDDVRWKLADSKPIIAWVIGRMEWSAPVTYVDSQGRSVVVASYEHVVILTGYDVKADTIRFMSNGKFYDVPTQTFMTSWGVLGNMAVIHD